MIAGDKGQLMVTLQGGTSYFDRVSRMNRIFASSWKTASFLKTATKLDSFSHAELNLQLTRWAHGVLDLLNLDVHVLGEAETKTPLIFVGNHISYIDIPLLMAKAPVVFVAKKQIGYWPIFGTGCRAIGVVMVDRNSKDSRELISDAVAISVKEKKQSLVLFPSGTTRVDESRPWRWGAFKIAHTHDIPIQPFRLRFSPLRAAAFIDDDAFVPHLWRLLGQRSIETHLEFHPPVRVTDPENDCEKWWRWSRAALG